MSARKDLIESIESALNFNKEGAEKFFDKVVLAIKEEIIPKDQTYQEFFGLDEKPQLIQGYTAEQWQEIIDGEYLCEFSMNDNFNPTLTRTGKAYKYSGIGGELSVGLCGYGMYPYYRPAQIKGVMRPIFVEPSAPETWCSFFGDHSHVGDERWCVRKHTGHFPTATKYIEL